MPIIVPCPSCKGQLRVADDLIGRKVRCPACAVTFDATESATPPAAPATMPQAPRPRVERDEPIPPRPSARLDPSEPVPTETLDPWKHLDLELTSEKPAREEPPPVAPRGAIEVDTPEKREEEPSAPRRARLNDDHDDLQPCPSCGRMVHRDSRRCLSCGARLRIDPEDDERLPHAPPRLDREPHRGPLVLTLGIVGLAGLCAPLSFLAIVPSIMAWVLGTGDLRKIRLGTMDPYGEGATQAGWICGIVGTAMNGIMILFCSTCLGMWSYGIVQQGRIQNRRPPFAAPPAKKVEAPPQ